VILLVLIAWVAYRWWQTARLPDLPETLAEGTYRVARVIDGDTLLLANRAKVRLIGVDCPEWNAEQQQQRRLAAEATGYVRRSVRDNGGVVRLQFDRERLDKYGRFLAYVWIGDRLLNEELLREGLARARLEYHYSQSMKRRFQRAEAEAQAAGRGMWALGRPPRRAACEPSVRLVESPATLSAFYPAHTAGPLWPGQ